MTALPALHEPSPRGSGQLAGRFVIKPAPVREPPLDDELPTRRLNVVGPHDRPLPFAADPSSDATPRLVGVRQRNGTVSAARSERPDPYAFSRRLVIGIIEAATGRRSASQLAPYTAPAVLTGLSRDAGTITRLGTARRPATLHSIHVLEPVDGVAEVAAVVRLGGRFRAIALRLEATDGRWQCVRLQIG
jgi:hypothetical protein